MFQRDLVALGENQTRNFVAQQKLCFNGLFRSERHKWGMASTAACESSAKEQTAEHVITSRTIYHHPNRAHALANVDKSLVTWLTETCLAI